MAEVTLTINGKTIVAKEGDRLIDVASRHGIHIPRFCYMPKLSVVGSCRMCLVEIEGCKHNQASCSTLVSEGMVVRTDSESVLASQKAMMQFLLVNHPLHCPICDQGGECELQDTAMGFGEGLGNFQGVKRTTEDEDLGPLVATDMSLCIHCTRCVRFGREIAGVPDLGLMGRGDTSEIKGYLKQLRSELSGNIIDLCPVGALTSKPMKFKSRSWGLRAVSGISPHDCLGSNLSYHVQAKGYQHLADVMRVVPRENVEINDMWLSDRDRFGYEGIYNQRLLTPKMKQGGCWIDIGWQDAIMYIADKMQALTEEELALSGAWFSNHITTEEAFSAQHFLREMGVKSLDHRLWESTKDQVPLVPATVKMNEIVDYDVIVLVGVNIRYELPLMALKVKEASAKGAKILSIGCIEHDYHFPHDMLLVKAQALGSRVFEILDDAMDGGHHLLSGLPALFIVGEEAMSHPHANEIKQRISQYCQDNGGDCILLTPGPNALGASAAGCLPNQGPWGKEILPAKSYQDMLKAKMRFMWLHQVDPDFDVSDSKSAKAMLSGAYVVALSTHDTEGVRDVADIMLPLAAMAETSGSFINYNGIKQSFSSATRPSGESRMGWSIYQTLHSVLCDKSLDYEQLSSQVASADIVWPEIDGTRPKKPRALPMKWMAVSRSSWVRTDMQLRHSPALQKAYPVLPMLAAKQISGYKVQISKRVAPGTVVYEKGTLMIGELV